MTIEGTYNKNLAIANRSRVMQLRTQYVEGIYDNPMILKSRSRVTQGHWKRNNWTDHTRVTISRVIWRWILLWPWNVGQRSLKVIENGTIWKLGYGFLFAFHSNYGGIFSHFGGIQRQRMIWPWNLGLGSFKVCSQHFILSLKVIETGAIQKLGSSFLFVFYSNYGRICSRLWDI